MPWIPRILSLLTPPPPSCPPNLRIPRILRTLWNLQVQVHGEEIVPIPTSATSSSSCDLESKGKEAESKAQHAVVCGELKEKKTQKKFYALG